MSEEKVGSAQTQDESNGTETKDQQYVSRKAYEEVTRDMHKNKHKAKELEAAFNELQTQLKAQEEAKMQEQEQWKELYQKREAELEQERRRAEEQRGRYMTSVKLSALKQEIGANVRDEYLRFASLDSIVVNEDGTIDAESLRNVANDFRKEHGQLIPQSDNTNITGHAPGSGVQEKQVDFSKMTPQQLVEFYANHKNKQ